METTSRGTAGTQGKGGQEQNEWRDVRCTRMREVEGGVVVLTFAGEDPKYVERFEQAFQVGDPKVGGQAREGEDELAEHRLPKARLVEVLRTMGVKHMESYGRMYRDGKDIQDPTEAQMVGAAKLAVGGKVSVKIEARQGREGYTRPEITAAKAVPRELHETRGYQLGDYLKLAVQVKDVERTDDGKYRTKGMMWTEKTGTTRKATLGSKDDDGILWSPEAMAGLIEAGGARLGKGRAVEMAQKVQDGTVGSEELEELGKALQGVQLERMVRSNAATTWEAQKDWVKRNREQGRWQSPRAIMHYLGGEWVSGRPEEIIKVNPTIKEFLAEGDKGRGGDEPGLPEPGTREERRQAAREAAKAAGLEVGGPLRPNPRLNLG